MTAEKPKHDQLFRKSLENPIVAYELLQAHLPQEVLEIIDTSTLKLEKESFIEPDLSASIADVLFSAKFNDNDGFIYLLLEHQSTPEHFMAFRLFKYMVNICDRYRLENPKSKNLPLIYPLIIYNGTKDYNVPRNLWELFNNPMLAKKFWAEDHKIVNVHDIPDKEFKTRIWAGILEFFLKHRHEKQLLKRWQEIADILAYLDRYQNIKFTVVTTGGDEFFLADDTHFYWSDLMAATGGSVMLRRLPNAEVITNKTFDSFKVYF